MPKFPLSGYHPHATRKKPRKRKGTPTTFFTGFLYMFGEEMRSYLAKNVRFPRLPQRAPGVTPQTLTENRLKDILKPPGDKRQQDDFRERVLLEYLQGVEDDLNEIAKWERFFGPNFDHYYEPFRLEMVKGSYVDWGVTGKNYFSPGWIFSRLRFTSMNALTSTHIEVLNLYLSDQVTEATVAFEPLKPTRASEVSPFIHLTRIGWFPDDALSPLTSDIHLKRLALFVDPSNPHIDYPYEKYVWKGQANLTPSQTYAGTLTEWIRDLDEDEIKFDLTYQAPPSGFNVIDNLPDWL